MKTATAIIALVTVIATPTFAQKGSDSTQTRPQIQTQTAPNYEVYVNGKNVEIWACKRSPVDVSATDKSSFDVCEFRVETQEPPKDVAD